MKHFITAEEGLNSSTKSKTAAAKKAQSHETPFHETYHWENTISQPVCDLSPKCYTPEDVVQLAKDKNTGTARLNAESWTQAAMTMYFQQMFSLTDSPVPEASAASDVQKDPAVKGLPPDDLEEQVLGKAPVKQGSPNFEPYMKDTVLLSQIQ